MRPEVLVCGAICIVFLAFNAGHYLPFGGWTPGPRFLLPALPFAAVLVALAPVAHPPAHRRSLIAVAVALMFVATVTMPNAPEAYSDPLYDLWLPRLLNRDIAQTIAWARWGLHGIQPLIVLGLGLTAAAAALLATFRPGTWPVVSRASAPSRWPCSPWPSPCPLRPRAPSTLLWRGGPRDRRDLSRRLRSAPASVVTEDREATDIWAQIENRGPALDDTRVVFAIVGPDGSPTWTAWYDEVDWQEGSRRRVSTVWDTKRVAAGDYRLQVSVVSADQRTVYSSFDHVAVIRVHR